VNPYEILGVPSDATQADIKAAYRREAQKAHPDRGGSTERFQKVAKAWEVLGDPDSRALYDATGEIEDQHIENQVNNRLAEMFRAFIENPQAPGNMIDQCRDRVTSAMAKLSDDRAKVDLALDRLDQMEGRVTSRGKTNVFSLLVAEQRILGERMLDQIEGDMKLWRRVLEALEAYTDERPVARPEPTRYRQPFTTTGSWSG